LETILKNQSKATSLFSCGALSPAELAFRWGKSRQHIHDLIARNELRSFKSGRSRLISMSEIERIEGGEQAANDGIKGCRR